jgi:hypothetical protein
MLHGYCLLLSLFIFCGLLLVIFKKSRKDCKKSEASATKKPAK